MKPASQFQKLLLQLDYLNSSQKQEVEKAYELADLAHKNVMRESGDPYITHPLAVAQTLAHLKLDAETIIAGLLHDVVEDTDIALEKISKDFSPDVARLVDGVTKLEKIRIKRSSNFLPDFFARKKEERFSFEQHVDSLRKMLLATVNDMRVILIKLADRLHNMQTLGEARPDKRGRKAQETLEIYAPIAHRLGIGEFKGQLEDLSFPFVYPNEYKNLQDLVGDKLKQHETYVENLISTMKNYLIEQGVEISDIHGRAKHMYSLFLKLRRYNNDLSKIYDLIAIRIIVPTVSDCYQALGLIHGKWNPLIGRIKDYISLPKPNGYQSLHTTIFGPEGEIVEVQIRTKEMHEHAERGVAAHWHYKQKGKNNEANKSAVKLIEDLSQLSEKIKDPDEFKSSLNLDFLKDRIFVFTPGGDIIDLPAEATIIDFAYAIHSDIGNGATGAKINGKIAPLHTELSNGDIVEISTSHRSTPRRDWLKFVKTARARNHIKSRLGLN